MGERDHWELIHGRKAPDEVSWYRPHLERSLAFVEEAGVSHGVNIIDVGAGASTFVDDLLGRGYRNITVLDISSTAIERAKERLGSAADLVTWVVGDITALELPENHFDFWHDPTVFHFLISSQARQRYVAAVSRALRVNGHIVVATFGPSGPEKCSGLEVARYSADTLHAPFGGGFKTVASRGEIHTTPWGTEQEFVYCYCRMQR